MLKGKVTVKGTVSRMATVRQTKEGREFVSLTMQTVVQAHSGINKTIDISVSMDGGAQEAFGLNEGVRVEVSGVLTIKKRGENLYFNLNADRILATDETDDCIEGKMEFRGKIGKQVEDKTDKKGRKFKSFSAFSAEKVGEDFEYLWVRFIYYTDDATPFLQPKAKIEAQGTFELSAYNDRLSLSCKAESVGEYVPPTN